MERVAVFVNVEKIARRTATRMMRRRIERMKVKVRRMKRRRSRKRRRWTTKLSTILYAHKAIVLSKLFEPRH